MRRIIVVLAGVVVALAGYCQNTADLAYVQKSELEKDVMKRYGNHSLKGNSEDKNSADEPAQYVGGIPALMNFLAAHVVYPEECSKNGITGRVVVNFIVTKEGKVDDVWIEESVHPLLDEEAIRVVRLLENWIPARKNGEPVDSKFSLPISFATQ